MAAMNMNQEQFEQAIREKARFGGFLPCMDLTAVPEARGDQRCCTGTERPWIFRGNRFIQGALAKWFSWPCLPAARADPRPVRERRGRLPAGETEQIGFENSTATLWRRRCKKQAAPSQPRGEKVILVHRRDALRATKIYHEPLAQAENVEFRWNSTVSALLSGDRLTGVRLWDTVTGEESVVDCDGVFVSVGRQPATALAAGQLSLDKGGYIVAGETTETSVPGVYAVGDVRTKPLRQVVTAVADGAVAVHMAEEYIAGGI